MTLAQLLGVVPPTNAAAERYPTWRPSDDEPVYIDWEPVSH